MKMLFASLVHPARALVQGRTTCHDDSLRANQFDGPRRVTPSFWLILGS
jgi:hypothetical protein